MSSLLAYHLFVGVKNEFLPIRAIHLSRSYHFHLQLGHIFGNDRQHPCSIAKGKVLEVGVGSGKNLKYYPSYLELTAIDFSQKMIQIAAHKTAKLARDVDLKVMDAQDMYFADNMFDSVVTSCVFCSVADPLQGLKEIRRVCKNGGKVVMLEHVRSQKQWLIFKRPVSEI